LYHTRPVAKFYGLEGQNAFLVGKTFVFINYLKQFFLGTTQFGGHIKYSWSTVPEHRLVVTGLYQITKKNKSDEPASRLKVRNCLVTQEQLYYRYILPTDRIIIFQLCQLMSLLINIRLSMTH